jgi:hypothetical protein
MQGDMGFTLTERPNLLSFADGADRIETVAHDEVGTDSLKGTKS